MPHRFERIARVRIAGRVQGVGFRAWTVAEAEARGLRGWVRNLADGGVEAVFAGRREAVESMIEACRRGPRHAQVVAVDVGNADEAVVDAGGAGRFRQLPTA